MTLPFNTGPRRWLNEAANNWGRVVFVGVLDVIAGILSLVWPGITLIVLSVVLGISLLVSGIGSLGLGSRARNGWIITLGVLTVIAGIIILFRPGTGLVVIAVMAAIYMLFTGIADLTLAFSAPVGRVMFGILGVLGIIAGIILIANPGAALLTVALVVGISFLVRGLGEISTGFWLRKQRTTSA